MAFHYLYATYILLQAIKFAAYLIEKHEFLFVLHEFCLIVGASKLLKCLQWL